MWFYWERIKFKCQLLKYCEFLTCVSHLIQDAFTFKFNTQHQGLVGQFPALRHIIIVLCFAFWWESHLSMTLLRAGSLIRYWTTLETNSLRHSKSCLWTTSELLVNLMYSPHIERSKVQTLPSSHHQIPNLIGYLVNKSLWLKLTLVKVKGTKHNHVWKV